MRAHRHTGLNFHADAVLRHAIDSRASHRDIRTIDHFRIDACAHRFEHGFARAFRGQVDRAGTVEIERNACLVRSDQGENDMIDVAARQIMRFERIARNVDACFDRRDAVIDDHSDWHFAQPHADHFAETHRSIRDPGPNPEAEEIEKDDAKNEREEGEDCDADEIERFHGGTLTERPRCGKFNRAVLF